MQMRRGGFAECLIKQRLTPARLPAPPSGEPVEISQRSGRRSFLPPPLRRTAHTATLVFRTVPPHPAGSFRARLRVFFPRPRFCRAHNDSTSRQSRIGRHVCSEKKNNRGGWGDEPLKKSVVVKIKKSIYAYL